LAVVPWPEVSSPLKSAKQGGWPGILSDVKMLGDIFGTISPLVIPRQILMMRRRRITSVARSFRVPEPDPADL